MLTSLLLGVLPTLAQSTTQAPEPVITVAGQTFLTWQDYTSSPLFQQLGLRCGTKMAAGMDRRTGDQRPAR